MNLRQLLLVLFASVLWAQSPEATVSGLVTDSQGAVVPGVRVVGKNLATGVEFSSVATDAGLYSLRALPIGQYTFSAEQTGFKKYVRAGITLTTSQKLELNIQLELGQLTETVNVTAAATTLETRSAEIAQLVEAKTVEDMPIGDRRAMNIINITGAAVFVNYDSGAKPNFSLAGGRTQSQSFFIDGGTGQNMRLGIGQVDTDPPVETVAEVRVLTNGFSAEYGGSAGGVVIATTKSGTNQLKGTLFEYLRNEKLDAANFFSPWSNARQEKLRAPLRYNVYGGTVGGPVRIPKIYNGKDKTFFYFAYEGSRRGEGSNRVLTVPTDLQRAGNHSQTRLANGNMVPVYDPATTRPQGNTNVRDLFPGNIIPNSRFDTVGVKVLTFFPVANQPAANITGANNFNSNYVARLTRDNYTAKVDHQLGEKDKLTGRYIYNSDDLFNTSVFPEPAADTLADTLRHQHFTYAAWTRTLSPTILNELRFTYGNRINWARSKGVGGDWPSKIGLNGVSQNAFPRFAPTGVTALGQTGQERRQFPIQQFQVINNFSMVRGKHSMKFGLEWRPSMNYEINLPTASGDMSFSPLSTGLPGNANSGFGVASLLLGLPISFAARETDVLDRRSTYWSWFAQDDWNVTRNLTLNVGVRWETDTPIRDVNNRMNGFDLAQRNPLSGVPGVVKFAGIGGWRTLPYDTDWNNFGPRFGFAYKPFNSERTVIRGGFGVFFAHPFDAGAPNSASLGYEKSVSLNSPDQGITHPFVLRDGNRASLTSATLDDSFGAVAPGRTPNTAVTFYEPDRRTGYALQYNFTIQRELFAGWLAEAGFVANQSRKLASSNMSINQVAPDRARGPVRPTQNDRPFPQFTGVTIQLPSLGVSNYHAFTTRIEKRFAKGFNLLATYTWSKFLNNTNEGGNTIATAVGPYSDLYNRRLDYGPSENNVPQRVTMSSVYELPFGTGKAYLNKSPLRWVLGNWSLGAIALLQSGAATTVTTQVDTRYSFAAGGLRADALRNPNLPEGERTLGRWFDTAAFAQPADFRNGTSGVGILQGDGIVNLDLSLLRNFPIGENRKLQLRGEFFNIANHANFGDPGRVLGGPGFGVVATAAPARRVQIGARLVW